MLHKDESMGKACWAVMLVMISSCGTAPSHESFRRSLYRDIGKHVTTLEPLYSACSIKKKSFVGISKLANSNEEHKYVRPPIRQVGQCTYYCEVDTKTQLVVNVRIEGPEENCVDFP